MTNGDYSICSFQFSGQERWKVEVGGGNKCACLRGTADIFWVLPKNFFAIIMKYMWDTLCILAYFND